MHSYPDISVFFDHPLPLFIFNCTNLTHHLSSRSIYLENLCHTRTLGGGINMVQVDLSI